MTIYKQVIPEEQLQATDKILFIIHLAIGDYTYMQNMFRAFNQKYPHIKIDLFILENRCTEDESQWPFLKNYIIYDWLETCGFYNKIYRENYAPHLLEKSILEAKGEKYPITITLGTLQNEKTEVLGRRIAGKNALLVGLRCPINWYRFKYQFIKRSSWKELDISFYSKPLTKGEHISAVYNSWCEQLAGVTLTPEERLPFVTIPLEWQKKADESLYNIKSEHSSQSGKAIFINYIAKDPKRSWRIDQAITLIKELQKTAPYDNSSYIINTTPEKKAEIENILGKSHCTNTVVFSATENFYQLPAMLKACDLIVSVETSIIHLANAVKTPVVALMRRNTPEWDPLDRSITTTLWCAKKNDNIESISPQKVAALIVN